MTRGRHSLAPQKSTNRRRVAYFAAPLVTTAVVGLGVVLTDTSGGSVDVTRYAAGDISAAVPPANRTVNVSRSADRTPAVRPPAARAVAAPKVAGWRWATADLDLRATPKAGATVLGTLQAATRIAVTGQERGGYAEVAVGDPAHRSVAWVTATYLADTKPTDPSTMGLSDAPCPDSSVEHGLTPGAVRVYRAVCHAFPQVTQYGGWAPRGEHANGKAIDVMTTDVALGNAIAAFLQAHASELDLYDVIWHQRIWTPVRASEGWRSMPDRGSPTANHMNHVHVSVN